MHYFGAAAAAERSYIGSSSYAASQIVAAQWTARNRHLSVCMAKAAVHARGVVALKRDIMRYQLGGCDDRHADPRRAR
jgi:hypothetical protein